MSGDERNTFSRRADKVVGACAWADLVALPVLGIMGIWWHMLWVVLALIIAAGWMVATGCAYDSRYQR